MSFLNIKLEEFEGPLDVLLKLIDKNKIDIYDIPISKLTDDYIYYIKNENIADMEEMSQFIYMASMLLELKSKMLLPREKNEETDEEIDPREELVKKLIEYKKYKNIAEKLYNMETFSEKIFFKPEDSYVLETLREKSKLNTEDILEGITLSKLYEAFNEVLKRKELKTDKIRSGFKSVTKALYNINDKIVYIKDLLILEKSISFNKILKESSSKVETVVTFLAILELIKTNEVMVFQRNIFEEIIIKQGGKDGK